LPWPGVQKEADVNQLSSRQNNYSDELESDFLHFYLTTLQFKNFNIPCMHNIDATRGQLD